MASSTALIAAAMFGHEDIVRLLAQHGANLEATDEDGYTAMQFACLDGHLSVVRVLLESGVDANKRYRDGWFSEQFTMFSRLSNNSLVTLVSFLWSYLMIGDVGTKFL